MAAAWSLLSKIEARTRPLGPRRYSGSSVLRGGCFTCAPLGRPVRSPLLFDVLKKGRESRGARLAGAAAVGSLKSEADDAGRKRAGSGGRVRMLRRAV